MALVAGNRSPTPMSQRSQASSYQPAPVPRQDMDRLCERMEQICGRLEDITRALEAHGVGTGMTGATAVVPTTATSSAATAASASSGSTLGASTLGADPRQAHHPPSAPSPPPPPPETAVAPSLVAQAAGLARGIFELDG